MSSGTCRVKFREGLVWENLPPVVHILQCRRFGKTVEDRGVPGTSVVQVGDLAGRSAQSVGAVQPSDLDLIVADRLVGRQHKVDPLPSIDPEVVDGLGPEGAPVAGYRQQGVALDRELHVAEEAGAVDDPEAVPLTFGDLENLQGRVRR